MQVDLNNSSLLKNLLFIRDVGRLRPVIRSVNFCDLGHIPGNGGFF